MHILSAADVEAVIDVATCEAAVARALTGLSLGSHRQPPRWQIRMPDVPVLMGLMPAFRSTDRPIWGLKDILVAPDNRRHGLDSHQGAVLLHDGRDGRLFAIVDATSITAIRTAAVSALATRALARPDVSRIAILGTGAQARRHIEAMRLIYPAADIAIWGRTAEAVDRLTRESGTLPCRTVSEATAEAGVICTVTGARSPILGSAEVSPGCHINAVGASAPTAREISGELMARATLFVESREQAAVESGDHILAMAEGAIAADHFGGALGDVLLGRTPGRPDPQSVTLFKSLGVAVADLEAAALAVSLAEARGVGIQVPW
jgi:ornithine cyclodeaminase